MERNIENNGIVLDEEECKALLPFVRRSEELLKDDYDQLNEFERNENSEWYKENMRFLHSLVSELEDIVW